MSQPATAIGSNPTAVNTVASGNAIVAVYDWRMGATDFEGYTVYKVSPEGEFLWGEEGITLEGEKYYDLVAYMSICQMTDGSYVFAWCHNREGNYNMMSIELQRITAEAQFKTCAVTLEMATASLNSLVPVRDPKRITPELIVEVVAEAQSSRERRYRHAEFRYLTVDVERRGFALNISAQGQDDLGLTGVRLEKSLR